MANEENNVQPIFSHAEPVLAVHDVLATVLYWQNILRFPTKWTWGDPPVHGAVSWQGAYIQFSFDPALAAASKGNSVWMRVQHIEALYNIHQKNQAEIVAPLANQPWGMAQYTVKDINGYYVHFAGMMAEREKSTALLPESISIVPRCPSMKEFLDLQLSVGWSPPVDDSKLQMILNAPVFSVVAENTIEGKVVGCALLLGDNASFYYVKDVMVHPDWQGTRVGTALMQKLTEWLEDHAPNNALVSLICNETLEPFYKQFGFAHEFAMLRYIHHEKDKS